MPASRRAAAVPPVERISIPRAARAFAKSVTPVLSETETSALRTLIAPLLAISDLVSGAASLIDDDHALVGVVDPNHAPRDHADRLRIDLVVDRVDRALRCPP